MRSSLYIGRVGALAVALGIGAAVATTPGIALAEGTESNSSPTGGEAPSNAPATNAEAQSPGPDPESSDDGEGSGPVTDPPDMNVSGSTVDTSTNDGDGGIDEDDNDDDGEAAEEEEAAEAEEPAEEPANESDDASVDGSQVSRQNAQPPHAPPSAPTNVVDAPAGVQRKATTTPVDDTAMSFTTAVVDDSQPSSSAKTFSSLALTEEVETPQNPVSALVALPLRIVSGVLTAIVGGPNTPPGENPLFLGLLAFVRRQFSSFSDAFSNDVPDLKGYSLVENPDGTFTVTVDPDDEDQVVDPDSDELSFSATDGEEGTVEKTGEGTFVYTPGDDFDGEDSFTLTVSDTGGFFGFGRKTDTIVVTIVADDTPPTEPDITQPPVQQEDGTFEAALQFDLDEVTDVAIAEGFEPKYWTVEEVYNTETGELELKLTPTQAGMLRAALGLDTTDSVGFTVTTTETQTVQMFAMRTASFAALAAPDYTLELPDLPTGHFELGDPIVTSPGATDPAATYPAGVVVTERYAYVVNSNVMGGGGSTLTVIGADPEEGDYLQVVDEIPVGNSALLAGLAGDRLYIADGSGFLTVIDTDNNTVLDPVDVGDPNGVIPIVSPDEKKIYLINQQFGRVDVIDVDPANTATYHTVVDSVDIADDPTVVDNGDGTLSVSGQFPLSGAFNADGTRLYLVRDTQSYTVNTATNEISDFTFTGEIVTIDTATNDVVGTPLSLGDRYGYFASSDGRYLYVPTLDMNGFVPNAGSDISPIIGSVTVIDLQDPDNPAVAAELPTGNLPVNVVFSPDKSLAYVVDAGKGTVWVIDTANQEVLDLDPAAGDQGLVFEAEPTATLGQVFNVIAASPDGTRLFVTNFSKGTVVPLEFVRDV